MSLIESYMIEEGGFHPFLVRDSWQVAKLNYREDYHLNELSHLQMHKNTDRAFTLLNGTAVLIVMDKSGEKSNFKVVFMQPATTYNISKNVKYAITMEEKSELFIAENPNTHIDDIEYSHLNENQSTEIRSIIEQRMQYSI